MTNTTEYQMGWNDTIGNLAAATNATPTEKQEWAQKILNNQINLPNNTPEYTKGTKDAATAYLTNKPTPYLGPKWVTDHLTTIVNAATRKAAKVSSKKTPTKGKTPKIAGGE